MKELKSFGVLVVMALLLCIILCPFMYIGFDKLFSICMVLSFFYNAICNINKKDR